MTQFLWQLLLLIHAVADVTLTVLAFGIGLDWNFSEFLRCLSHPTLNAYLTSPLHFVVFCAYRLLILLLTFVFIRCGKTKKMKDQLWINSVLGLVSYGLAVLKLLVLDGTEELDKNPKLLLSGGVAMVCSVTVPLLVRYVVHGQKTSESVYERLGEEEGEAQRVENGATLPTEQQPSSWALLKLIAEIFSRWNILTKAILFMIAYSICDVFMPWVYSRMILVVVNQRWDDLEREFSIGLVVNVLQKFTATRKSYYLGKLKAVAGVDLRQSLFNSIIRQPMAFFDVNESGSLVSRFSDSNEVVDSLPKSIEEITSKLTNLLFSLPFLFYFSWQLALATLVKLPINILIVTHYGTKENTLAEEEANASAACSATISEVLSDMREVRALGGEEREQARFSMQNEELLRIQNEKADMQQRKDSYQGILDLIEFFGILLYGAFLVKNGKMSSVIFMTFGYYKWKMHDALQTLNGLYTKAMETIGKSKKVVELLRRVPEIDYTACTEIPDEVHGHIVFDEIEFAYPTRPTTTVLNRMSLSIEPGLTVALVGPSGNGKSTIVSLLEQFYHPTTGSITLDGIPIHTIQHQFYREKVALVSQSPTLFSTTVRENIMYGLKEAVDDDEMIRITKMANVHKFVSKMDKGYDTLCGPKGVQLSGGQKQRIAIARALIRRPKVLILDEATSALDAESEHLVQEALAKCAKDITVLVVAHRLSTIRNADKIAVIENGRVVELGNHEELMLNSGSTYFKMVQRQMNSHSVTLGFENLTEKFE